MRLQGSAFVVRVFGWHCQRLARALDADGKRLGEPQDKIDRVIADAVLMMFEGKGCEVVS